MVWVVFILVYVLLSREYVLLNEEFLFISSFLLFFFLFFNTISDVLAESLDKSIFDLSAQFKQLTQKRLQLLKENKVNFLNGGLLVRAFAESFLRFICVLEKTLRYNNMMRMFYWYEHFRDMLIVLQVGNGHVHRLFFTKLLLFF